MRQLLLRHSSRIVGVLLLVALITALAGIPNRLFDSLENTAYDQLLRLTELDAEDERVVLVDINEDSIAQLGPWPWPRSQVALLIRTLTDFYSVSVLGVDIVFPEARVGDEALSRALNQPTVVMSQVLDFAASSENRVGHFVPMPGLRPEGVATPIKGFIANHPKLLSAAAQVGHISPVIDEDGKVRRVYPVACGSPGCTPTLTLKMLEALAGNGPMTLRQEGQRLHIEIPKAQSIQLDLDPAGRLLIPYHVRAGGFRSISAAKVLDRTAPQALLNQAVVILGSTSLGLGDAMATPTQRSTPGFEIHAQLMHGFLDRATVTPLGDALWVGLSCLLIGLSYLFWPWRSTRGILLWGGVLLMGAIALTLSLFSVYSLLVPLSPMPLMVVMTVFLGLAVESVRLNRRLTMVAAQFSRFIPESLVSRLLRGRWVGPKSEMRELSILIADMRGFTSASEGRTPEAVAALAQQCLETLTRVVYDYGGTIEKYSGDGLMAVWGAPKRDPQHAKHAVEAGLKMQVAVKSLKDWFRANGFEPMRVSIGINTGDGAVGVMGGEAHMAWTAHGDAVNVASRIEALTRTVGVDLLLGQRTAELYGLEHVRALGPFKVKGREASVSLFTVAST